MYAKNILMAADSVQTRIKDYLYKSYKASFDKGILSISQQRGVITLIHKKAKSIKKIYNW